MSVKRLFIISLILVTATAWGEQNVPVNVPGGGAADLLNVTTPPDGRVENNGVQFTCTDAYGRSSHRGEAFFDECMKQKREAGSPKPSPSPTSAAKN